MLIVEFSLPCTLSTCSLLSYSFKFQAMYKTCFVTRATSLSLFDCILCFEAIPVCDAVTVKYICFIICSIYLCTMLKIVCEIKFSQCHTLFIICSVNFTESKSLNLIILYFSCDWLNFKKKFWNLLSPFCLWLVKVVLVAPVGSC